jgi:protein-tyrosine kinase
MSIVETSDAPPAAPAEHYEISSSLVVLGASPPRSAEAINALRSHLQVQHLQQGRRALVLCAPSRGAGCSFVTANLAVSMAQAGVRTLLIDGDMRSPSLPDYIRPATPKPGLAECLSDQEGAFLKYIQEDVLPDLSLLYAGTSSVPPQTLLAGDRLSNLLHFCLREFDLTLIDTPPANTNADARTISGVVGYAAIVAGRDLTFSQDIKTLASELMSDRVQVVGTILNGA